jgi:hypothetical protein
MGHGLVFHLPDQQWQGQERGDDQSQFGGDLNHVGGSLVNCVRPPRRRDRGRPAAVSACAYGDVAAGLARSTRPATAGYAQASTKSCGADGLEPVRQEKRFSADDR